MYCLVCGSQRPVCHKNPFEPSVPSDSVRALEFYYLGKHKLLGRQDSQKPRFTAGIYQKNLSINNEVKWLRCVQPVDYSPRGSSIHDIVQVRILK